MAIPTMEELRALGEGYSVVPLAVEMFSDVKTSVEILRSIRAQSGQFYILESVIGSDNWGRYSFLGYDPKCSLTVLDGAASLSEKGETRQLPGEPLDAVREVLAGYKSPRVEGLPPFTGGFVGYFAYDFVKYFEPGLKLNAANSEGFYDLQLMLMDKVIAFDHFRQKITLIVNLPCEGLDEAYPAALEQLEGMRALILSATPPPEEPGECGEFIPAFTKDAYCDMVRSTQHYIHEGDIFQAVISNRLAVPFKGDLLHTYRVLRTVNPSPYMVYLHFGDLEIAGASPETLVSLQNGRLATYPLAGTAPRGANENEDKALGEALLADEKELAEHDMLVDLGRNDLGKISRFGSVQVERYRDIKRFSHVMHIASKVTGEIAEGYDALDAVAATLPAGTLSGAPKRRACEIIDELEGTRRGPYGGAMGYIDFTGNMDMCIGIRMAVRKNGRVFVQSGGGIVADSVPEKEYVESINKAQAVMNALQAKGE